MTTYDFSSTNAPNPASTRRRLVTNHKRFRSPFTGAVQTAYRMSLWEYTCEWVNVSGAARAELLAFLYRLDGLTHRARMPEFNVQNRGAFTGSPVIDGAGQTGDTLNIRNAVASVTDWARAGDWISFESSMHQVVADADSDFAGDVTLEIRPRIRTSPADGATVNVALISGVYLLTDLAEIPTSDQLASGEPISSSIVATFLEDVLA